MSNALFTPEGHDRAASFTQAAADDSLFMLERTGEHRRRYVSKFSSVRVHIEHEKHQGHWLLRVSVANRKHPESIVGAGAEYQGGRKSGTLRKCKKIENVAGC